MANSNSLNIAQFTYLFLLVISIAGPFALSFDKKVAFYRRWFSFFKAMIPVSLFYLLWDIIFTQLKVWQFNANFTINKFFFHLPIEEYGFFIVVPYCSLFIYECLKSYWPQINQFSKISMATKIFNYTILALCFLFIIIAPGHLYTNITFGFLGITTGIMAWKKPSYSFHLYAAWLLALLPMSFVNGILTSKPILIYNNSENLGFRIGSIPIEDFFYHLLFMIWMIALYEINQPKGNDK